MHRAGLPPSLRHLLREGQVIDKPRDFGVALLALALLRYTALPNGWLPVVFGDPYYWQAIACVLLLLGLGWAPVRLAVNRFTTYLGCISYSLYLNHATVIVLISPLYPAIYRQGLGLTLSSLPVF